MLLGGKRIAGQGIGEASEFRARECTLQESRPGCRYPCLSVVRSPTRLVYQQIPLPKIQRAFIEPPDGQRNQGTPAPLRAVGQGRRGFGASKLGSGLDI